MYSEGYAVRVTHSTPMERKNNRDTDANNSASVGGMFSSVPELSRKSATDVIGQDICESNQLKTK
jgi:hypothetical protein